MVHHSGFLKVLDSYLWIASSPSILPLFYIIGWLMGHISSRSLCFWACFLELSQSQSGLATHPEDLRLLGIPMYLGLVFSLGSPAIFSLKGWVELLFSLFRKVQCLPIHRLGSIPIDFWWIWALPFHWKPKWFLDFNLFVSFWVLVQYCDILDLNTGDELHFGWRWVVATISDRFCSEFQFTHLDVIFWVVCGVFKEDVVFGYPESGRKKRKKKKWIT